MAMMRFWISQRSVTWPLVLPWAWPISLIVASSAILPWASGDQAVIDDPSSAAVATSRSTPR